MGDGGSFFPGLTPWSRVRRIPPLTGPSSAELPGSDA